MKWLVAPQELKGSLRAAEAARAIAQGLLDAAPSDELDLCPVADGGPGTVAAALSVPGAVEKIVAVTDPLGRRTHACFAVLPDGTAVLEMAAASGIALLHRDEYDAERATTFGTGELLRAAKDAPRILLGLGGSATSDGGRGALLALGAAERDGALDLRALTRLPPLTLATDVDSPLLGPNGSVRMFGPQKGLRPEAADALERRMERFADGLEAASGREARSVPGAGAAGGLGFGLIAAYGAHVEPGFDAVARLVRLEDRLRRADAVVTAEGRYDAQSLRGKGPHRLAAMARALGIRSALLAGRIDEAPAAFDEALAFAPEGRPAHPAQALREAASALRARFR